jgi:F-type H+-transporting ATPase subunit b
MTEEHMSVPPVVFHQAVNLAILCGILFYFLKDNVRAYYKNKRENFLKSAREVAEMKRQVEEQAQLLKNKIRELDTTADQAQKAAEASAREYQVKLLGEAREQAEKLKRETEKTVKAEVYRAVESLKAEIVDQSITSSRQLIGTQIKDNDQKRLLSEFVEKIGVVRQ